jgi:hypothetical protein
MRGMRTTVDIPDALLRRAKSEAALRGRKLKDLVEEGLRLVLEAKGETPQDGGPQAASRRKHGPSAHDLLKDLIFKDVEGPSDLSTNPKYFDDFGR